MLKLLDLTSRGPRVRVAHRPLTKLLHLAGKVGAEPGVTNRELPHKSPQPLKIPSLPSASEGNTKRVLRLVSIGALLVLLLAVINTATAHARHAKPLTKQQVRKCVRASTGSHRAACRALVIATRREGVKAWWAWNPYVHRIIRAESSWAWRAVNRRSGACGLGQMLPCRKYGQGSCWPQLWRQARCLIKYTKRRYQTPRNAWMHHLRIGWY